MKFNCYVSSLFDVSDSAVVLFCQQDDQPEDNLLEELDILTNGAIGEMYASGEFNGSAGSAVMIRQIPETDAGRVILAGIGKNKEIDYDAYRMAAGQVSKMASVHKLKSVAFYYDGLETNRVAQAMVEGFALGSYRYLNYKTGDSPNRFEVQSLSIVVAQRGKLKQAEAGCKRAEIISWAVSACRDLGNRPGNDLYPETYARYAGKIAKECGIKCKVLEPAEIKKEKMGAFLSVGAGSARPPRFVILEYNGGKKGAKPVVLVGKGITFDSGGISLKPGLDMGEMKGDMLGSAVVLLVIAAAARLNLKINLVALMPLAENMPSGKATRPGDIITSRAGHTIEIINTDAEGRLILADAIDFADRFHPQAVIDIATLTGASLYILGYAGAPFVGTNQKLNDNLRAASANTAEKIWEMPLWPEFARIMESDVADIKNSGGKQAGTLTAASFLKKFVGQWPWAHIDIAYCDLEKSGRPYVPKGVTGFGVRLLIDLLSHWKKI